MKRRSAIKTLSLGIGYTLSAAGMATFVTSCKQDGSLKEVAAEWAPTFMTSPESTLVEAILDAMLPTTAGSPGYKAVSAIQMFDNTLSKLWKKEDQEEFKKGLAQLSTRAKLDSSTSDAFSPEQLDMFMKEYMGELPKEEKDRRGGLVWGEKEDLKPEEMDDFHFFKFIHNLRQVGISTYFSNETIATEYLAYDPVPGVYEGCTELTEGQKNWSL